MMHNVSSADAVAAEAERMMTSMNLDAEQCRPADWPRSGGGQNGRACRGNVPGRLAAVVGERFVRRSVERVGPWDRCQRRRLTGACPQWKSACRAFEA